VDELSLGLAPKVVTQLFQILDEINREGTAILLVEQFVHMALEHTHRAYVLTKGQLVLEGPSARLRSSGALEAAYLGESTTSAG
jgi:branched-chain amino acid transport system ATP-binding protein